MEYPKLPPGLEGIGRIAGRLEVPVSALVNVAGGSGHGATHELAGARRPALLEAVDQHLHREPRLDRRQHVAGAPPRRQAAPRAAGGTGENDAAAHDKSSGIQRGDFMIVAVARLSDSLCG
jgi:hypothetical protein